MISSIKKVFSMIENNAEFKDFEKGEMIIIDKKKLVIDKMENLTTSIVGFFENEVTLCQKELDCDDNYITISYACLSNEILGKILMYLINYL